MQFLFDGVVYKVIKISGPKHNMLGLVLGKNNRVIETIALKSTAGVQDNVSPIDVEQQVIRGVEEVYLEFGVKYEVKQIQFVSSDTPSANVYKELTIEILKKIIFGGIFTLV